MHNYIMFGSAIIAGFALILILNILIEREDTSSTQDGIEEAMEGTNIEEREPMESIARKGLTITTPEGGTQQEEGYVLKESKSVIESNEYINQTIPYIISAITSMVAFIIIKYRFTKYSKGI